MEEVVLFATKVGKKTGVGLEEIATNRRNCQKLVIENSEEHVCQKQ